jgi:pimeloyl-ACP methyl ester carboxylesterase
MELQALFVSAPWLLTAPSGDGHPVMVLPGLSASDRSTFLIRQFLKTRGYRVYGWDSGPNRGLRFAGGLDGMANRIASLADRHGQTLSLVGFSLGGTQAQRLAEAAPGSVRRIISVGSPFRADADRSESVVPTDGWRVYENVGGRLVGRDVVRRLVAETDVALPMHCVTIFSRSDGIVGNLHHRADPTSVPENLEQIEVISGHYGLLVNPAVFFALADRLAQPSQQWRRFSAPILGAAFYPS